MATDVADWTQSVVVQSGTVSITGTAIVSISGTVPVTMSGNPQVQISNVPSVTIASGSVTIGNASIGVINAAGTVISSATSQVSMGSASTAALGAAATTTLALPTTIQSIVLVSGGGLGPNSLVHVLIRGTQSGVTFYEAYAFSVASVPAIFSVVPVLTTLDTSLDVTVQAVIAMSVRLTGISQSEPEFLQYYQPAGLSPNRPPLYVDTVALAAGGAAWVLSAAANLQINLFDLTPTYVTGTTLEYIYGHGATLPGGLPAVGNRLLRSGNSGAFLYDYHGSPLPRGDGIYVYNNAANPLTISTVLNYSIA